MVRYGYVVDLSRCTGCRACQMACKVENSTIEGVFWMYVFKLEEGEYPHNKQSSYPRPCMHCENPPCVKVCPVGARYRRNDDGGQVLTDFDRCIGCRYCAISCPYGVNYFNWSDPKTKYYHDWDETPQDYGKGDVRDYSDNAMPPYRNPKQYELQGTEKRKVAGGGHYTGVMEKCTFCVHRVDKGIKPACVANCPMKALAFGDLDDPESDVSKILEEKSSFRLLEELGTRPRVYYVGGVPMTHDEGGGH